MKIVLALSTYQNLTGSEVYTYELARVLTKRGHKVTILALTIGGELLEQTKALGIDAYRFFDHPEFDADIIHTAQPNPTSYCLRFAPDTPIVCTIHSGLVYERPILADRIHKYITVRPEIKQKIIDDGVPQDRVINIFNGVDRTRFKDWHYARGKDKRPLVLFVGTNDHLRQKVIGELIGRTAQDNKRLLLVGQGMDQLVGKVPDHVSFAPIKWNVEDYVNKADETASIYLGRTTIEGWACGRPGWIYDVDDQGNIVGSTVLADVPEDMNVFDIEHMTDKILEVYEEALQ